jgi:peptidoglycan hydrolase-like protein with peptidoglycan-binding domain
MPDQQGADDHPRRLLRRRDGRALVWREAEYWLRRKNSNLQEPENRNWLLEEYKALRAEITTSMQSQNSILTFGAATLGIIFGGASQASNAQRNMFLLVLTPLLCYLILTIWFAEVMRMLRAGAFLMRLEKRADERYRIGSLTWESVVNESRCGWGIRGLPTDPDRFRTGAITLLFLALAGGSIVIGWSSAPGWSWQHVFAVVAAVVAPTFLLGIALSRKRQIDRLLRPILQEGERGPVVQSLNNELGLTGDFFGAETTEKIKELQRKRKLEVDGVVGLMTWHALEAEHRGRRRKSSA